MAEIGVGMLGYAFMGKAHSNAFRKLEYMAWPPPLVPRLVAIAGRNDDAVAEAARRSGSGRVRRARRSRHACDRPRALPRRRVQLGRRHREDIRERSQGR